MPNHHPSRPGSDELVCVGFWYEQHATQIMEAAQAGKAIFCEKPISLNLEIIDQVGLQRIPHQPRCHHFQAVGLGRPF